jgi:glycosyltransferase involved in cell wall biosynthesis
MNPVLSVIMPVFNAAPYLREAIESVLAQTFTDFEFIIINDGSTDESDAIVRSFTDPRIKYLSNSNNQGLIASLNRGLDVSLGEYIARMDSDDVCDAQRFELQLKKLKDDPQAALVCSPVLGITPGGKDRDHWPVDIETRTPSAIRSRLRYENCISHPTVMIRSDVLKKYRYSSSQKGSEDWDLWLRLARDGWKMVKTDEVLLRYRIHPGSVTVQHNTVVSPQLKSMRVKWNFFLDSMRSGRANGYVLFTLLTAVKDYAYHLRKFRLPAVARSAKRTITISPLKAAAELRYLHTLQRMEGRIFLFFPYAHLGGAEKVHARIVALAGERDRFVFITGIHDAGTHVSEFGDPSRVFRCGAALYHPFTAFAAQGIIRRKVEQTPHAVLFGSNNDFYDRLAAILKTNATTADLTHDISYENAEITPAYIKAIQRMDLRFFISHAAAERTRTFYRQHFFDDVYFERIRVISNYVDVTDTVSKTAPPPLRIIYAGRDTPEKAVNRIFDLALLCEENRVPVEFVIAGPMRERKWPSNVRLEGQVDDPGVLSALYAASHCVIITSLSEGFPLSMMEGMAHGCVPVATAVGDIPFHIKNGGNGLLVDSDEVVASAMLEKIRLLLANGELLRMLSANAFTYARRAFDRAQFEKPFRELFEDAAQQRR